MNASSIFKFHFKERVMECTRQERRRGATRGGRGGREQGGGREGGSERPGGGCGVSRNPV